MRQRKFRTSDHPSRFPSLWLLTAALCLCPAAAQALDPTETATGNGALASQGSGAFYSTADGYTALQRNTTGSYNTAAGAQALYSNTSGAGNTACGGAALIANTTGTQNSALGFSALYGATTGNYNTASGARALYGNTTGNSNSALGFEALQNNGAGSGNVAAGANALYAIKGSHNIALGVNAGKLTTAGDSNIYIGHPGLNGSESKVIRVGQSQTKTFIAGIKGVPLSGATVVVNAAGQLGVVASSARYKQDIAPLADSTDKLAQLRPVSFRYKSEPDATHYGLIAEEVDKVMPELVVRDEKNRPESVQYQEIIPLLLQQWKAQQARLAREEAENARQRALIDRQGAELAKLRRALATRLATLDGSAKGGGVK